jgi:hypothetical protein
VTQEMMFFLKRELILPGEVPMEFAKSDFGAHFHYNCLATQRAYWKSFLWLWFSIYLVEFLYYRVGLYVADSVL